MPKSELFVARPNLPEIEELLPLLESIWDSSQLTNNGPLVQKLSRQLESYFQTAHVTLCGNGTLALICALKSLKLPVGSEVITTPYSFVATASAIVWAGLKPVFVDIEEDGFNISASAIAAAVTENTSAIVPVHCYGKPCDVQAIQDIADHHGLSVIYDAAHAFGVDCDCGSLLSHGDASIVSFHATKVFHTFEGGCVVTKNTELKEQVDLAINFGFRSETEVDGIGINAKMSEFNAAIGLLQIDRVDDLIAARKKAHEHYNQALASVACVTLPSDKGYRSNYSYYPVLVSKECKLDRDALYNELKSFGVFARRYFFPLITDFESYKDFRKGNDLPNAQRAAEQVLCLPIHPSLDTKDLDRVCSAFTRALL
ncbi:DegT/DnrJ/EryC1/StrS family aminotransferase [Congregibacter brevis]|uniref:DegT/DnrJ/EryC1/StrS family aminotransferase n=1 Tax=Congregibacter brevis TaxID=3081201 RepID=A0ABZ0ICJ8_9GAMM|nr:DegT/DnrJ/EryC1/StrS family aminotransferase [Congregibacter sp. IMCC45268]